MKEGSKTTVFFQAASLCLLLVPTREDVGAPKKEAGSSEDNSKALPRPLNSLDIQPGSPPSLPIGRSLFLFSGSLDHFRPVCPKNCKCHILSNSSSFISTDLSFKPHCLFSQDTAGPFLQTWSSRGTLKIPITFSSQRKGVGIQF